MIKSLSYQANVVLQLYYQVHKLYDSNRDKLKRFLILGYVLNVVLVAESCLTVL